jgi:TrmH family RNA methyltransferase
MTMTTDPAIDSVRHPAARRVSDVLRSRATRPKVFVIDDQENIEQAVASGVELDSVYVTASAADLLPTLAGLAPAASAHIVDDGVAGNLFGEHRHARVFAIARTPRMPTLRELGRTAGDIVVLDGVRLVGNIGAITRTACALSAAGVVVVDSGLRSVLDRRLIRASRGLVFATHVVLAGRSECADFVRAEQLTAVSLEADAVEPLASIRVVDERLALILGGERTGVSSELAALTTHRYAIPMNAKVESLNVSVAAGIALYEHRTR